MRSPAVLEQICYCAFCGAQVNSTREAQRKHILSCPLHPAADLVEQIKELRGELKQLREENGKLERNLNVLRAKATASEGWPTREQADRAK